MTKPMSAETLATIEGRLAVDGYLTETHGGALLEEAIRLRQENADLKAALAKTVELAKAAMLAGEDEWRPIGEAPTDGNPVLVTGGLRYGASVEIAHADGSWWKWQKKRGNKSIPTHFRPLPAPPVSPEAREDALARLAEVEAGVV